MNARFVLALLLALAPLASKADDKKDNPIGKEMKGMNADFKQLKKQIGDPAQKDSSLKLIADMKKHAKTARGLTPDNAAKIPEADRTKWMDAYKKKMDDLLGEYDKLESAVSDGKTDEAKTLLGDVLNVKRQGHEEFNKEEK